MDRPNARTAFLPLTGRWLRYALQGLAPLLILLLIASEWGDSYAFCAHCGLRRTLTGVRIATRFPLEWPHYQETNYHLLYALNVSPRCPHQWCIYSGNWVSVLGGHAICEGHSPVAFRDYPPDDPATEFNGSRLPALARLHDPAKIRQVLNRVRDSGFVKKQGPALVRAFTALDAASNPDDEQWWRQYGPLFQAQKTPTLR